MQLLLTPPDAEGALATLAVAEQEMAWSSATAVDVARQQLTRSRAYYLLGRLEEAEQNLVKTLALAPADAALLNASAHALQGEIAAAAGHMTDARRYYQQAVLELTAAGADRDAAQLWFELGSLLADVGDAEGALDAFKRAGASTGLLRMRTGSPSVAV